MAIAMGLLEILACAAAAAMTTYLMMEKRELLQFTSAKAEELYTLVESFDQGLNVYFSKTCSMIAEGYAYNSNGDADWTKLMLDLARARMLISFYFPALLPTAKRADAALSATVGAMRRFQANRQDEPTILALEQTLIDMRETLDALKHAVVMAHRDNGRPRLARRRHKTAAQALRMAA
ncbi:MAG: hypothetical protein KGM15_08095 [Pseudomonadota bacterium]|nr:hypothetical protein [Pseudomonadota bacterium]